MKVGVLALQGDARAHIRILGDLGSSAVEVRTPAELADVDALVIPGGESTSIRIIANASGMLEPLRRAADDELPILGTCAGLIACASHIVDGDEPILGHVDIDVRRNAYGRQNESFETTIDVAGVEGARVAFIRAPRIERVGEDVEVLGELRGSPVAVRQRSTWLLAFHPEITGESRIHDMWLRSL